MRSGRPSLTARWVAAHRARLAGSRPSSATGDPEAEARLSATLGWFFTVRGTNPVNMDLRTRFIDNEVAGAIGAAVAQVVIIGAGYDGRALRFGGGTTRWFEVDFPSTQADKRRRLHELGIPDTEVAYAGVDLITDDLDRALASAGHDATARSLFICEGLLTYLPLQTTLTLCTTLRSRAAPGSTLALNVRVHPRAVRGVSLRRLFDGLLSVIGERRQMRFEPDDIEKVLALSGWHPVRSERSSGNRLDDGGYLLLLAAEPAPLGER